VASEESFIKEVTEEVRRERLFGYLRRYGWIGIVLVLALVGGAAWNELRNASARAEAEARGDAILRALDADSPQARASGIAAIEAEGDAAAIMALMAASQATDAETSGAALDRLDAIAADMTLAPAYRDLARFKAILLRGTEIAPADRIGQLEQLTIPGAPYRPLALEAMAYAHVENGETDKALAILTDLIADSEVTQGLRQRASQLIVALGGTLDAS
jgi:hypothetical protein